MSAARALHLSLGRVAARQELILVAIIIATVLMMVLPMPTFMADGLIAVDIGMALVLVLLSLYVRAATELSTLPSLILLTTAFRLSISITTSRLVLVQGDAGAIIRTFGEFVIAGNVVVGLVVYLIITVVQFVVITKGSERVAEVAARFNLDALPGKQISIDTDVRNGDVTQAEARRRRMLLEKESQLYGAMDGAMKFVKGDAIASLVIIAVNLVGGMAIGCLQRGLPFSGAARAYSLLAVGDGLIAQVPALLVSLTAGLVVTRAVAEDGGNLGQDIMRQITSYAWPMRIAGIVLAGLGAVPGFPTALFAGLGMSLVMVSFLVGRVHRKREAAAFDARLRREEEAPEPAKVSVKVGAGHGLQAGPIGDGLKALHGALETDLGIRVPKLRLSVDASLPAPGLTVLVDGICRFAVPDTAEEDIALHVRRAVLRCASDFVGIQETQALVARVEGAYGDLVREAAKAAPLPRLAEILRLLVEEQVPVGNMRAVLEAVVAAGQRESPASVADHVRAALKRQICLGCASSGGELAVVVLEGAANDRVTEAIAANPGDPAGRLDAHFLKALAAEMGRVRGLPSGAAPVLLATAGTRRFLQQALRQQGADVAVLCHAELAPEFTTRVAGTVSLPAVEKARASLAEAARAVRPVPAAVARAA